MSNQGSVAAATQVKVVQPGGGRAGQLAPGIGVVFKIDGEDSGGALSIVEHPFDVGALVPPHIHTLEDEFSIVLEGEIGFRSEDREVVLGPGGYVVKPRGEVHAMWNAGATPARMIEVISPAGFEQFFREVADMTQAGAVEAPVVAELAGRYGLPFADPDWLPDVIARYNLTPPPGA
ncbi:MAG: cupin domain-containing protein [Nitriliruptorales bacterium]|nr:cupin domain-containing protein [Nitriliruptorales bacterium]